MFQRAGGIDTSFPMAAQQAKRTPNRDTREKFHPLYHD
jgi:hypothetical protein